MQGLSIPIWLDLKCARLFRKISSKASKRLKFTETMSCLFEGLDILHLPICGCHLTATLVDFVESMELLTSQNHLHKTSDHIPAIKTSESTSINGPSQRPCQMRGRTKSRDPGPHISWIRQNRLEARSKHPKTHPPSVEGPVFHSFTLSRKCMLDTPTGSTTLDPSGSPTFLRLGPPTFSLH